LMMAFWRELRSSFGRGAFLEPLRRRRHVFHC
jgi:hypothetical protein